MVRKEAEEEVAAMRGASKGVMFDELRCYQAATRQVEAEARNPIEVVPRAVHVLQPVLFARRASACI